MKSLRPREVFGAILTIVGIFLPWENSGGVVSSDINGVKVYLGSVKYWVRGIHTFPVNDYGGVLIICLTLAIVFLALRCNRLIKNPILWKLVLSAALLASSLFFLGRGIIHAYEDLNFIEPRTLMFGFFFVVIGSVLLLWEAVKAYRETIGNDKKSV